MTAVNQTILIDLMREAWRKKKVTCNECGGSMCLTELSGYMAGFEAAGGNANDVWPGWNK